MKTIKPQRLAILHRTFENDGRAYFVPSILVCFAFDAPEVPIHEAAMWKMIAAETGPSVVPDEGMRKSRGEVLVFGKAYSPTGMPVTVTSARLKLGAIDKRLYVVGDRRWDRGTMTNPTPFTEMPITWANAYGGEGFDDNPLGKGASQIDGPEGIKIHPLPNIEDPKKPVSAPRDRPRPVGFGPLDINAPSRRKRAGTYDRRWQDERYPGFPVDIDWLFFNTAPEDQWIDGFFTGGDPFAIEGMNRSRSKLEGRVPRLKPRCFVTRKGDETHELGELRLNLDTLLLFPGAERGVAIYRGLTEVTEDDAADIGLLLAACEAENEPKSIEHYGRVVAARLDKEKGGFHALRDRDLLPPLPEGVDPMGMADLGDLAALMKPEGLLKQNFRRRAEAELERTREKLRENNLDPDEHVPRELPPWDSGEVDLDNIDELVERKKAEAEQARIEAEKQKEELTARAKKMCEEENIDFDELVRKAGDEEGGPPKFKADAQLEFLRDVKKLSENSDVELAAVDAALDDPKLYEKLVATEQQLLEAYRRAAHQFPPAKRLGESESLRLRVMTQAAKDAGESLVGRDLTGADLSGIDLSGADLRGALLEASVLRGAKLDGAVLEGAVLVRADLTEASFQGARLAGANLGHAKIHKTNLTNADLSRVELAKAELVDANLEGAVLDGTLLLEAVVRGGRFSRVRAKQLVLNKLDLSDVVLAGAELPECVLIETRIDRVDFTGANLEAACFVQVTGEDVRFDNSRGARLRVVQGTNLPRASFKGATLTKANFRGIDLRGADFEGAELTRADFSEANLEGANLERINAPHAMLVRTNLDNARMAQANLLLAILQKAHVENTDLRQSNLFRADFAKVVGDKKTRLEGANVKQVRFVKRSENGRA